MVINEEVRGCHPYSKKGDDSFHLCNETEYKRIDVHELEHSLTQQARAVAFAKMELRIFPCNKDKSPIVDQSLGFKHGVKDATSDTQIIAKTWFRYPDAAIGFAIPRHIEVFDCDVLKDLQKRPLVSNGLLKRIGLESFQKLINDLNITGDPLYTLSVRTQSGGTHFYFLMPDGISSFNHVAALPGLDLKGYGGYTILPNSAGEYGEYRFLNMTEIRPIPEPLLKWAMQFRGKTQSARPLRLPAGNGKVDREEIVRILTPYWSKGDGRRNELTLAIAGFLAHSDGREEDARFVITELAGITGKGADHISGSKYAFRREGKIKGLTTLKRLMEEIKND